MTNKDFVRALMIFIALWCVVFIVLWTIAHSAPASAYTQATRAMECTLILRQMRGELVGDQRRGAEAMLPIMDKESRKVWWEEFPFEPYDRWMSKRLKEYPKDTTVTEYATYWDMIGCGRSPWTNQ